MVHVAELFGCCSALTHRGYCTVDLRFVFVWAKTMISYLFILFKSNNILIVVFEILIAFDVLVIRHCRVHFIISQNWKIASKVQHT